MEIIETKNSAFGEILSDWRKRRRFSQLGFGLSVDVSARHLSFLETGRAKPSREMVLKLADSLEMPKREINRALLAAGFAPAYVSRTAGDLDLVPIEGAIGKMLENHLPYPAISIDRVWNIVGGNEAAMQLMNAAGFGGYNNILHALAEQSKEQSSIINWEEAVGLSLERVRTELEALGGNVELENLENKLAVRFLSDSMGEEFDRSQAVIPTRFNIDGQVLSVFSVFAQFGTVQDMALDELKIELMFPMDEETEKYFCD